MEKRSFGLLLRQSMFRKSYLLLIAFCSLLSCDNNRENTTAEDSWYSYMHDQRNSGVTSENLSFPLFLSWERKLQYSPNPAWPAPAKQDYYNGKGKLEALVTYDRAFHPIVARGKLFIASSANNSITCFNSITGDKIWKFYTDGPNRNAPLWHKENLYFGSDDGNVYCLGAESGELIWKKQLGSTRKLVGNGRVISASPIRTGVVANADTIYVASGLLPEESVTINACDASSGVTIWEKQLKDLAPQGYPVLSDSLWYVPNSRIQPMAFRTKNGELSKKLKGAGGDYITLIDGKLIHGVNWAGEIKARNFLEAAMTGYKVVGNNNRLFIASDYSLTGVDVKRYTEAFSRKEKLANELKSIAQTIKKGAGKCLSKVDSLKGEIEKVKASEFLWQKELSKTYGMIKTSNTIIVGLQDQVIAFDEEKGVEKWKKTVKGRAYGLAVCGNKLYVSTDQGYLYCFGEEKGTQVIIDESDENQSSSFKGSNDVLKKVKSIGKLLPRERGIMMVCNLKKGDLVYRLSQNCNYYILGVEQNEKQVSKSRKHLDDAGIYGPRTTIFRGKLDELNLSDYLVNVVVIDEKPAKSELNILAVEIARILSPAGGRLLITNDISKEDITSLFKDHFHGYTLSRSDDFWVIQREVLSGGGEWTHLYANPSNTVSTTDKYATDTVRPLWFGQPGPREMSDRHHRAPSPLFKNGILFIPKDDGVIAADAYNGTLLWQKEISQFRRIKISRDAGNMALSDDMLYAVADNFCLALDPATGAETALFRTPQIKWGHENAHWGYLATEGDMLFGSGSKSTAIFNRYSRLDWSEYSRLVTSDYLFGMDRKSGKVKWTYKGGAILNPSICMGDGKMYFVESLNNKAMHDEDGLIPFNDLKKHLNIVALNSATGKVIWKKAFNFSLVEHILYGSFSNGVLVMSGSGNKDGGLWFGTYAFDANTGDFLWNKFKKHLNWTNSSHGEQIHRALIMDGTVYTEPFAFDLKTGKEKEKWMLHRNGHACGTISGADDILYFRGTNPSVCIPEESDQGKKLNNISRPGCWINMIPAGGLLMIPEASSGCTCGFPLQMSIVYQPVKK